MLRTARKAFTLVEILIVVVILGVLAAIVTAGMMNSVNDAKVNTAINELGKIRRALEVYIARNNNQLPPVAEGDGTWGPIVSGRDYLKSAPRNPYVGGNAATVIVFGAGPDATFQTTHGWIFDEATGEVWAGNFDADGQPLPTP
jgi:prepilin-type N-terminal cleavage/methylation domain-containing protein